MEIAAVSEALEGEILSSHTPLIPDVMRLVQASDTRLVAAGTLYVFTENVTVCLRRPDVAIRITHPFRALVVVNFTLPVVAPVAIVSEAGIANAAVVGFSWTTVGEAADGYSEMTQVPETPGVRTVGVQDSDKGLVDAGAAREMVTVTLAAPRAAVMTALCGVVIVAADAVKVAEVALAAMLTEAGTVKTDEALLESVTKVLLMADFERVTVQVVLALDARVAAAH